MFNSKENIEILKHVFDEYSKQYVETLPSDDALAHLTFSEEFEQKMRRIIKAEKNRYYYLVNTLAKRVACIVLAIILSFTTVTFSVDALREPFVEFVVEVYEKFTSLFFSKNTENQGSEESFVFKPIEPTYIPEGYKLESSDLFPTSFRCIYKDLSGNEINFLQKLKVDNLLNIDTENSNYQEITFGNQKGVFLKTKE